MKKDWLDKELTFITWLYKYKNFLGALKQKDFTYFPTREEAIQQFEGKKKNKMKKIGSVFNIGLKNVLDIMYEPNKNRYSILEYNGSRKEISKKDFHLALILYEQYGRK